MSRRFAALAAVGIVASAFGSQTIPNIEYFSPGSTANRLDLVLPNEGVDPGAPTIIHIHGGGWAAGDKSNDNAFCRTLADAGYSVVNMNYTLATPESPSFPQAPRDVKAVIRWVRTVGVTQYGLSPRVVVTGGSAGGHLGMLASMTSGVDLFEPLPPPGELGYQVQGCVGMWGLSDLVWDVRTYGHDPALAQFLGAPYSAETHALYASASPITHVTPCDPPSSFYHGTADPVVPYQHSIFIADALSSRGVFAEVHLAFGAGHGYSGFGGQVGLAQTLAARIPFITDHYSKLDVNHDGFVTGDDFDEYVERFEFGGPAADFNRDGFVNGDDFDLFVLAFERGC